MGTEIEITKDGVTWLDLSLTRSKNGTIVEVRAHPQIELFFGQEELAMGVVEIGGQGNRSNWVGADGGGLLCYRMNREIHNAEYTVGMLGYSFNYDEVLTNLSFLRLKGISSEGGLKFIDKTVMSVPGMIEVKNKVGKAFNSFCKDYIVPVTVRLTMVSLPTKY